MSGVELFWYSFLVVDLITTFALARARYRKGVIDGVNAYRDYLIAGLPPENRAQNSLELRFRALLVRAELLGVKGGERVP